MNGLRNEKKFTADQYKAMATNGEIVLTWLEYAQFRTDAVPKWDATTESRFRFVSDKPTLEKGTFAWVDDVPVVLVKDEAAKAARMAGGKA